MSVSRTIVSTAVVAAFVAGVAAGGVAWRASYAEPEVARLRGEVERLQQQIGTLQARLRARETPASVGDVTRSDTRGVSGAALNDERAIPFMRRVVTAPVEPSYRLQAIRYVGARGDQQSLAALRVVMQSPNEQPSIRDAAAQAYALIGGQ